MPALKVNIIIVHPRGDHVMMFTASAGINCFIILKLDAKYFASLLFCLINANISLNEQPDWFHWAHRLCPF